jgi:two-component system cell cycle response regulator DivK
VSGDAGSGTKVVLVVDDNELNLKLVAVIMTRAGFRVLSAETAEEALEIARRELPHVVLMDIKLPAMDGLEATRLMKADPALSAIPVVAVTALARPEDRAAALSAGCVDFVTKPLDMKQLVRIVQRVTGGEA